MALVLHCSKNSILHKTHAIQLGNSSTCLGATFSFCRKNTDIQRRQVKKKSGPAMQGRFTVVCQKNRQLLAKEHIIKVNLDRHSRIGSCRGDDDFCNVVPAQAVCSLGERTQWD